MRNLVTNEIEKIAGGRSLRDLMDAKDVYVVTYPVMRDISGTDKFGAPNIGPEY